jgi:hypothetical protein
MKEECTKMHGTRNFKVIAAQQASLVRNMSLYLILLKNFVMSTVPYATLQPVDAVLGNNRCPLIRYHGVDRENVTFFGN